MNGLSVCLDEIALEGLDGITLSTLWRRLENATPRLWSTLDKTYKEFLWKSVSVCDDVQTFLLKEPREDIENLDGNFKVNTIVIIEHQENGVRGSSSTFHSRVMIDVSHLSLENVEKTYGNRLTLVASQDTRENVLFPPEFDSCCELSNVAYCLLEWIGQARKSGRQQCDGMNWSGTDHSTVFHHVRALHGHQLITKQKIVSVGNIFTAILYLPRFHVDHIDDRLANSIYNIIHKIPSKSASVRHFCDYLYASPSAIMKSLSLLLDRGHIAKCRDNLNDSNIKMLSAEECEGRTLEHKLDDCFAIVKPFYNLLSNSGEQDKESENGDIDADDGDEGLVTLKIPADMPIVNYAYSVTESRGMNGFSTVECSDALSITRYSARAILKQLENSQKVTVIFEDVCSTRRARYISTKIFEEKQRENLNLKPPIEKQPNKALTQQASEVTNNGQQESPSLDSINILEMTKKEHANEHGFTEKFQRRRKLVKDFLRRHKVVVGTCKLRKHIIDTERESGMSQTIDKRTIYRLLTKLNDTGVIQVHEIEYEIDGDTVKLEVACDKMIAKDSPQVLAALNAHKAKVLAKAKVGLPDESKETDFISQEKIDGVELGYLPKMPRAEMMHLFLYFLIYELAKPDVDMDALRKKFEWAEYFSPSDCITERGEGLFTPSSIFMLFPLSVYVKVINVTFEAKAIEKYLNDPSTKHLPIKDLPCAVQQNLSCIKSSRPNVMSTLYILASINAITPTSKSSFKYAADIICHLNKKAALLDTRVPLLADDSCEETSKSFPEIVYEFSSLEDVKNYWFSVRNICLGSHLHQSKGSSTMQISSKGNLRSLIKNESDLYLSIKPIGDGLGVAGFDSSLFAQSRRSWTWIKVNSRKMNPTVIVENTNDKEWQECFATTKVSGKSVRQQAGGKGIKRKNSKATHSEKPQKKTKLAGKKETKLELVQQESKPVNRSTRSSAKKIQRSKRDKVNKKIKTKAKLAIKRAHWSRKLHDKRDQEAEKQRVFRVSFTPQEQKLLFICTLALRILGKKSTDTGYTDWLWTRDVLYKDNYESAKTKTAITINRKYRNMLSDPQTSNNLNICITDCKQEETFEPFCNLGKTCDESTFNQLVELLKKKYSMENMETRLLCLPSTLRLFQQQYNLPSPHLNKPTKFDENIASLKAIPGTVAGVRYGILKDSIVSALLLENEGTYDPNVAFAFLNQFSEDELTLVVSEFKKKNLVTKKKLGYRKGYDFAFTAFSETMSTNGQRFLDAHFAAGVVQEAVGLYQQLKQNCSHTPNSTSKKRPPSGNFLSEENLIGGRIAAVLSLLSSDKLGVEMEIPDDVLCIEYEDEKKPRENAQPASESSSAPTEKRTHGNDLPGRPSSSTSNRGNEANSAYAFTDVLSGIEDHLFGICGQSQKTIFYKIDFRSDSSFKCSFTTDHVDSSQTDSLHVKEQIDPPKSVAFEKYNKKVVAYRKAGAIIHPPIRTNPCNVGLSLLQAAEDESGPAKSCKAKDGVAEYFQTNVHLLPEKLEDCLSICSKQFRYTSEDCQALSSVYRSIERGKEIGVTQHMIECLIEHGDILSEFSLGGLLKILESFRQIYEVGFMEVRYVTKEFKNFWSLPILSKNFTSTVYHGTVATGSKEVSSSSCETQTGDSASNESLESSAQTRCIAPVSRPWFCMDGKINKTAYNTLHESVLRYIMRYPGVEEFTLAKYFIDIMFPVTLQCILQTLEECQCITKKSFVKEAKATLFAPSQLKFGSAKEYRVTYFLPAVDAIIKLADCVFKE